MRDIMTHRGPDDSGIYVDRNVGLAHRRLSIIDLSTGHQPMSNEDDSIWIVFNGEIYNYIELRNALLSRGHVFKTLSDTEAIIHAYEEYGIECLQKLRGMFSFVLWDNSQKLLFGARDRLGEKPFYYTTVDGTFIFSSEIKSILLNNKVKREVNDVALYCYLNNRYVPGPETMFRNIWKLQPGHYLLIQNKRIQVERYWDVNQIEISTNLYNVENQFLDMLKDCVRMRLMSEVPLGVFLSGGLDSSMVVALMSKISNSQIKTFSVGYEEDHGVNEFSYARLVAEKYDTDHHELPITTHEFRDVLPDLVWHMDEPISDPAAIPLLYLSRYAKKHVTVILSGEGADEILAGYYIYKKMLAIEKYRELPESIRRIILNVLMKCLIDGSKFKDYLLRSNVPLENRYRGVSKPFSSTEIASLFSINKNYEERLDNIYNDYYRTSKNMHPLNKMLYADIKTWLPDDLLMKADKMTMAASQELRVPYLDHELVEFTYSLPIEKKINNGCTKYLLKKVAEDLIPKSIVYRKKKGFPIPISHWFKGSLNDYGREILLDSESSCRMFFTSAAISEILDKHKSGKKDYSESIWNLMVFETWHKQFIEGAFKENSDNYREIF